MNDLAGFALKENLWSTNRSITWRAIRQSDQAPVVLKVLAPESASAENIARLRAEYEITRLLSDAGNTGVVKALAMHAAQGQYFIVMEDIQGRSLKHLMASKPLELPLFFSLATQLCQTMVQVHAAGVIHRDLKPDNIVYSAVSKRLALIDFGSSTQAAHETREGLGTREAEGTLAYMAPEQTGRMNRPMDYRVDMYAMGATFHELLAGQPPFTGDDALEIIHAHLARQPLPLHTLRHDVPPYLSAVILKLLAKSPEDRYQSCQGLLEDLQRCQTWHARGERPDLFEPGSTDLSPRLELSRKLVGREAELAQLNSALRQAGERGTRVLMLAGYSGIGKSSLVDPLQPALLRQRGYLARGKCAQFTRMTPYAVFAQAVGGLVGQVLAEPEIQVHGWRTTLGAALGQNAALLSEVVPDLRHLLGDPPPPPPMGPMERHNRMQSAFMALLGAFARRERPLVLVLDDLQWADRGALDLLSGLAQGDLALLVLGSYRDNEVDASHPLRAALRTLQQSGVPVDTLEVGPLQESHVQLLLQETLRTQAPLEKLAQVLHRKSGGNPFFLGQLLQSLHRDGHLRIDLQRHAWTWDDAQVESLTLADNVGELLAQKMGSMAPGAQLLVHVAACMGSHVDPANLGVLTQLPPAEIDATLRELVRDGLLLQHGSQYRFAHDKVHQAANALRGPAESQKIHAMQGLHLLRSTPAAEQSARLIDIASHLMAGHAAIGAALTPQALAELYCNAGLKAKLAAAYGTAAEFLSKAAEQLDEQHWKTHYALAFSVHFELAQTHFLCERSDAADVMFNLVMARCHDDRDRATVLTTRVSLLVALNRPIDSLQTAAQAMALLGDPLPDTPEAKQSTMMALFAEAMRLLGERPIAGLMDLPDMTDEAATLKTRVLIETCPAAVFVDMPLYICNGLKMFCLTMQHGKSTYTPFTLHIMAIVLASFGKRPESVQFGDLAVRMADAYGDVVWRCKAHVIQALYCNQWSQPMRGNTALGRSGFLMGQESGDPYFACCGALSLTMACVSAGYALTEVVEETQRYEGFARRKVPALQAFFTIDHAYAQSLAEGATRGVLADAAYFEALSKQPFTTPCFLYCIRRVAIAYMFDEVAEGMPFVAQALSLVPMHNNHMALVDCFINTGLLLCARHHQAPESLPRASLLEQLKPHRERLAMWADECPANFQHQRRLLDGLVAEVEQRHEDAMQAFDEAVTAARQHGFVQFVALANEAAGRALLRHGKPKYAQGYLHDAQSAYREWGADAKAAAMRGVQEVKAGEHTNRLTQHSSAVTGTSSSLALDVQSVMKAALSIAQESNHASLVHSILTTMMENAGATRGTVLLRHRATHQLMVTACASSEGAFSQPLVPLDAFAEVPHTLCLYVERTRKSVILADAGQDPTFQSDPYVQRQSCKSMLCVPLVAQGQLLGAVLLENPLTSGAFTEARVVWVQLLAAQAAIAIDKANVYASLEEQVAERTGALQRAQVTMRRLERLALEVQMAGGFAHEMRNALASARYSLEGLLGGAAAGDDPLLRLQATLEPMPPGELRTTMLALAQELREQRDEGRGSLEMVLLSLDRALKVTQRTLDYAEATSLKPSKQLVHLGSVVQGLLDREFRAELADRGIDLQVDVTRFAGQVQIASEHAETILRSLVANARDAVSEVPNGRIGVRAQVHQGRIDLSVEDNGAGVEESAQSHVFEPFFSTKGAAGVGLSLGMSRKLAELYGGTLEFTSKTGQGATFRVSLPLRPGS